MEPIVLYIPVLLLNTDGNEPFAYTVEPGLSEEQAWATAREAVLSEYYTYYDDDDETVEEPVIVDENEGYSPRRLVLDDGAFLCIAEVNRQVVPVPGNALA